MPVARNWKLGTDARPKAYRAEGSDPRSGWRGLGTRLQFSGALTIAFTTSYFNESRIPHHVSGKRISVSWITPHNPYLMSKSTPLFPVSSFQFLVSNIGLP